MQSKTILATLMATMAAGTAYANEENNTQGLTVTPYLDATYALLYSDKRYSPTVKEDHPLWHEMYAKYGVQASYGIGEHAIYGSLMGLSSATLGDGDAGGYTTGDEHKTTLEEWVVGFKTQEQGKKGSFDVSVGRQTAVIGDGFMLAGDALNLGDGIDASLDRGGAYYLAARRNFDFAAIANYQPLDQLNTRWMYLQSDNKAQSEPELWATDWTYQFDKASLSATYLEVLDVNDPTSIRNDLKNYGVRGQAQLTPQWQISGEYVHQDQKNNDEKAWHLTLGYTFDQLPAQPSLSYRFSQFSEGYDPLLYGNTGPFGTWFQGEVAGNYSGPFNTNANIHQVTLQASPRENVHVGMLAYQYDSIDNQLGQLDGHEVDLFTVWNPHEKVSVIPLVGFYKPKKDASNGGNQIGGNSTNTYAQLILQYLY